MGVIRQLCNKTENEGPEVHLPRIFICQHFYKSDTNTESVSKNYVHHTIKTLKENNNGAGNTFINRQTLHS